ncbi:MAG: hypothetical protein UZ08_BCD001002430 [Candidatus Parvibacillus calidus]|nr:MAG: hypothetical protein UZ08_BCD001002430 [Candidatus Parvibacillus calidus]
MDIVPPDYIVHSFKRDDIDIIENTASLHQRLLESVQKEAVVLIMTSGNFGGLDIRKEFSDKE